MPPILRAIAASLISAAVATAASPPDLVLILTDDMRASDLAAMPHVEELLVAKGTRFTRYVDNVAICCPARATILCGAYSHSTGVADNSSYRLFQQRDEASTVAAWLRAAGYRTALFGKYLNGYDGGADRRTVPPGWDEWCSPVAGKLYAQFDYTVNELRDGAVTVVAHGHAPEDYAGDVYAAKAIDFVRRATAARVPYFLDLALISPHEPATPAPRHAALFPGATAPRVGNFDEADVSAKPAWVRALPALTPADIAKIDALHRRRLQSLQSVDEAVRDLVAAISAAGRLDDTVIVFASDNGFHLGNHRLLPGKWTPYEEDTAVPLVVRGPRVAAAATEQRLAGDVDLAPTLLEFAGVAVPARVDGRSLVPLLRGERPAWREAFLLEHAAAPKTPFAHYAPAEYAGLHAGDLVFIAYASGERELYDLASDPFQLVNLAADPARAPLLDALGARLDRMRGARGADMRAIEQEPMPLADAAGQHPP